MFSFQLYAGIHSEALFIRKSETTLLIFYHPDVFLNSHHTFSCNKLLEIQSIPQPFNLKHISPSGLKMSAETCLAIISKHLLLTRLYRPHDGN